MDNIHERVRLGLQWIESQHHRDTEEFERIITAEYSSPELCELKELPIGSPFYIPEVHGTWLRTNQGYNNTFYCVNETLQFRHLDPSQKVLAHPAFIKK